MDCTADLLLTFVWDETVSGTARSKTSVLLLTVPEAVLSHTKARSRSAVQSINFEQNLCLAPLCPRGSLVPYNSEEQISFNSFCAPHCPRGSLVPYKSEENQFHPVLASVIDSEVLTWDVYSSMARSGLPNSRLGSAEVKAETAADQRILGMAMPSNVTIEGRRQIS